MSVGRRVLRPLRRVAGFIQDRAGLGPVIRYIRHHKVPPEIGLTRKGWFYVFGQALVFVFLAQVVTGSALATKYIAAPGHAWESLRFLNEEVVWGGFVRGLHFFGASAMVLLAFVHMTRVFVTGSYKFPRELNWITGVGLLMLVLAMAFTGQLLRWDQNGVSTVQVAATMMGRVPFLGPWLMDLVLGGDSLGGATLSRFFALHVVIFPLLIIGLMGVHIFLVVRNGVSEPPRAGRRVDPATYRSWYTRHIEEGGSVFWPDAAWRELVFVLIVYVCIFGLAFGFGPRGPGIVPDPALVEVVPRPDWYFLWYYALIWYKPPALDTLVLVWFPLLVFPCLMLVPLLFPAGERAPARRPWAILTVSVTLLLWTALTAAGVRSDWIPDFETVPVSAERLDGAPGPVVEGAALFHERGCQYCHVAFGTGGDYGPDLTDAPIRMTREEMTVRTLMGLGNMPAYQNILEAGELDRILDYLGWAAGRGGGDP